MGHLHHLLLRRPWQYDIHVIYDGFKNTYVFNKDVHKIVLPPLKPMMPLDREVNYGYDVLALVVVEENEEVNELPDVVWPMLMKFDDVV